MLAERERGGAPCRKVLGLVKERLAALEQRLGELTALRAELVDLGGNGDWDLSAAHVAVIREWRYFVSTWTVSLTDASEPDG